MPTNPQPPSESEANQSKAERRLLTVLFCDLVNSTSIVQDLDPEETRAIIRDFQSHSRDIIEQFGGRITEYLGDGIVAQFTRHETNAERAINGALELIRKLKDSDLSFATQKTRIQVRCGIATGLAVVGDMLGDAHIRSESAIGLPLNLAARIQGLANPDEIVIAGDTHRLTRGLFEFEDMGQHTLKGIKDPQQIWRVLKEKHVSSRFVAHMADITPMVDRHEAMGVLLNTWEQSKHGQAATVVFSGEAGIGKSRILQELGKKLANDDFYYLDYQCAPYHVNTSLYPLISRFEDAAEFEHGDSNEQRLEKLESLIRRSNKDFETVMPAFASLLSLQAEDKWPTPNLDPEEKKQWIFNALINNMFSLADSKPLLIKIEDVHWIDPTTLELMSRMVKALQGYPILLLITTRPGFSSDFMDEPHVKLLEIDRLPQHYTAQLVDAVKGSDALPKDVLAEIITRTEGIPLFIEELSKSLLEGMTSKVTSMNSSLLAKKDIPTTLHDSLLSRLDRLPNESRVVAKLAAVIGREFSFDLLEQVADYQQKNLYKDLTPLLESQLVFQDKAPPSAEFCFKHALVRDVAYENLLQSERVDIHKRIAVAIEDNYPETINNTPELVARHFTEGKEYEKAAQYWLQAGKKASRSSANIEARNHINNGLELVNKLTVGSIRDKIELELLVTLGPILIATEGPRADETQRTYSRASQICNLLPESEFHFAVLWAKWLLSFDYNPDQSIRWSKQLEKIAEKLNHQGLKLQAHHAQWTSLLHTGKPAQAYEQTKFGIEFYDSKEHSNHASTYGGHDPLVCAYSMAAHSLWLLGYPDKSLHQMQACCAWAQELNHMGSTLHSIETKLLQYQFRKMPKQVLQSTDELKIICERNNLPEYIAKIDVYRGWALSQMGEISKGLALIKHGIETHKTVGTWEDLPLYTEMYAEMATDSDFEDAMILLEDGFNASEKFELRFWLPELYRRKALLEIRYDPTQTSNILCNFQRSIEISQKEKMKALELRAIIDLVLYEQSMDAAPASLTELRKVYDWFTEGFNTLDLITAKSMLDTCNKQENN